MSTETIPPPVQAKKKKARKSKFVVELNGVPCGFLACPKVFGPKLVPRRGVLVPIPNHPTVFGGEKSAQAAIGRALRLRNALNSAVFGLTETTRQFAQPGAFTVTPQE
jgi:hypothetical protein